MKINKLQQLINYEYTDKRLLIKALTHSSFVNEAKNSAVKYNERLEFLGDSVLGLVISENLFITCENMPEGRMTKIRAKIVCEPTLAYCARKINLGDFMRFGKGEELTGGRQRTSILADAFEALIASIYLDGGYNEAKRFILSVMNDKIKAAIEGKIVTDYKTKLQEIVQSLGSDEIKYRIVKEVGPDHNKVFHSEVEINETIKGLGKGRSKKDAEQEAAKIALRSYGDYE